MRKLSCGFMCLSALLSFNVSAEIKDYQVLRMIAMKTNCVQETMQREITDKGVYVYKAQCKNVSHYPDGVLISCSDGDDERSCTITAEEKKFNHLKLLQSSE